MSVGVSPRSGPRGTPITIDVKGIGYRSLEMSFNLLYDNRWTGWISAVTTHGSGRLVIPATGHVGDHVIEVLHGQFGLRLLDGHQSRLCQRLARLSPCRVNTFECRAGSRNFFLRIVQFSHQDAWQSRDFFDLADALLDTWRAHRAVYLCGNGGSASDSSHIATEFTCRLKEDRRPYPAMALTADGGLLTAIGNDYGFQEIFARQVQAFAKPGDVLLALSTSGKSRNVLSAIEEGHRRGMKTIALLGKGGGFTAGAADIDLIVGSDSTARIQEAHKFLLHVLCELVEGELEKE
jgi:D-sedoheptulose 7-phosphate isomerase